MSAPPLPEAFGNYALGKEFVEVVAPGGISWWPQTAGWWWLGAALLAWLAFRLWCLMRRWYRDRYRREAAARLRQLANVERADTLVAEINRLLKITALTAYSREQVASLSGEEWTAFLNQQCPEPAFSAQQCHWLGVTAYGGEAPDIVQARRLLDAGLTWVELHRRPDDV